MENNDYLSDMKKIGTQIRFDVDGHHIDANTLINILVHYKNLVYEINQSAGCGEREVRIDINALEPGSFVIDVTLVTDFLEKLFSKEAVSYLGDLASILVVIMEIYKKNKGYPVDLSKPEYQEDVQINNGKINVFRMYNKQSVRAPIAKMFETVDNDNRVNGFRISNKKGGVVEVDREEFDELSYDDFDAELGEPKERIVTRHNAALKIVKLSFAKDKRWMFIYEGNKISVTLTDPDLIKYINSGASFSSGDSLIGDLEIIQKYDYECGAFVNKDYKLIAYIDHVHQSKQADIPFPEEEI